MGTTVFTVARMPHSFGYRARTRNLFARDFRKHGMPAMSTYLTNYKVGDLVDIKANSAIHKGMPFKFYHGRTGRVFNVSKRALGIIVNKTVGNRIIPKRITVRVEHVRPSNSRTDFLKRVKQNEAIKKAARENKTKPVGLKRLPAQPRPAAIVKAAKTEVVDVRPIPYVFTA